MFFSNFLLTFKYIFKDKILLLLSMIPIFIGIIIYSLIGKWFYSSFKDFLEELLKKYILNGNDLNFILHALVTALITLILLFIVNWSFVVVASALNAPLNDFMAGRVIKRFCQDNNLTFTVIDQFSFKKLLLTFWNEGKKIIFILLVAMLNLILGFIPFLAPISIILTVILFVISFVDYSWVRAGYNFGQCLKDLTKNFITYFFGGFILMALMSVPIINLLLLPYNLVYFTLLWCRKNSTQFLNQKS